jgi:hypothetical protein
MRSISTVFFHKGQQTNLKFHLEEKMKNRKNLKEHKNKKVRSGRINLTTYTT